MHLTTTQNLGIFMCKAGPFSDYTFHNSHDSNQLFRLIEEIHTSWLWAVIERYYPLIIAGLIDQEAHGDVILDSRVIALRYLKGWFVVDFFSSLPIDYIFLTYEGHSFTAGRAIRILRLAKLLQLLRLLRISRLVRYVRIWQEVSLHTTSYLDWLIYHISPTRITLRNLVNNALQK